jgi:hypothetical protein
MAAATAPYHSYERKKQGKKERKKERKKGRTKERKEGKKERKEKENPATDRAFFLSE